VTFDRALPWILALLAALVWAIPFQLGWYGNPGISDLGVYREAVEQMRDGAVPYRDFSLEYPPLAAGLFLLVDLAPGGFASVFGAVMCVCLCLTVLGVMATARALDLPAGRAAMAGAAVAVSPLLLGNVMETRFDLTLAALLAWIVFAAVTGRWRLMWALLGFATLLKLIPLVLVPALWIFQRHREGAGSASKGLTGAVGIVVAGLAPFAVLSPSGIWSLFEYHLDRPLQIESLGGAYLLGLDAIADIPIRVVTTFGSQNLEGRGPDVLAGVMSVAALALIAVIAVLLARRLRRTPPPADTRLLVVALAATTAAVLVGGKVLSPQFLVWLLPTVFLVTGRYGWATFGIGVGALVLTQAYFPDRYWALVALGGTEVGLLVLRDLALVALVAAAWPRASAAAAPTESLPSRGREREDPMPESGTPARFLAD
jgi:hypothetical protein